MSKVNLIGKILLATDEQLESIEKIFTKLAEAKLNDGMTVIEADPDFEAGATVNVKTEDGQLIPMPPSGENEAYELEDGRRFTVVEEGVIAEVMEAGQEEEPAEEEPVAANNEPNEKPLPKVVIESVVKETKFSEEKEEPKEENVVEETNTELSTEPEPITHNPEEAPTNTIKFQWGKGRQMSAKDRVMRNLANRNN